MVLVDRIISVLKPTQNGGLFILELYFSVKKVRTSRSDVSTLRFFMY